MIADIEAIDGTYRVRGRKEVQTERGVWYVRRNGRVWKVRKPNNSNARYQSSFL
jgi:hypothetical protein